jgi:hypothetical protein
MATFSTGLSATWGGVSFTEIFAVDAPLLGGLRKDRSISSATQGWTDEVGEITISCYGTHNISTQEYGKRKALTVSGGGMSLTYNAVCIAVNATPELAGVTRFSFTAKLMDF